MKNKTIISMMILAGIGLIDSIYLLVYKLSNNNAMCLGSGDCATVNASKYSELYGIPISLLGVMAYLAILVLILFEEKNLLSKDNTNLLIFGISLVGVLYSAYLTYIEFFVIYAVCPFCVVSAVVMVAIFIFSSVKLARNLND